jgi:predicted RNA-binding Zn-ribbon protein involved in translation (DUF1610 family)
MADKLIIRCPNCDFEGEGTTGTKGSTGLGCALMFLFIIPGLIYLMWQSSTQHAVCPQCGFDHVVVEEGRIGVSTATGLSIVAAVVLGGLFLLLLMVL